MKTMGNCSIGLDGTVIASSMIICKEMSRFLVKVVGYCENEMIDQMNQESNPTGHYLCSDD